MLLMQVDEFGCQGLFHCYDNALQPSNRLNDSSDVERRKVKRLAALPREIPPACGKPRRHCDVVITSCYSNVSIGRIGATQIIQSYSPGGSEETLRGKKPRSQSGGRKGKSGVEMICGTGMF